METVLIVEDDDDTRAMLAEIVAAEGFRPVAVEAGDQAIEYLSANEPPCFVLLDLRLPRLNGVEFLRWLHRQEKLQSVGAAVMTGWKPSEAAAAAATYRERVVKVLHKPFDLKELL